jgi:hypothetical protein
MRTEASAKVCGGPVYLYCMPGMIFFAVNRVALVVAG